MVTAELIEKIEKTAAVLSAPVAAVIGIWSGIDAAVYTEATAGLIIAVCEYIKIYLNNCENDE